MKCSVRTHFLWFFRTVVTSMQFMQITVTFRVTFTVTLHFYAYVLNYVRTNRNYTLALLYLTLWQLLRISQ